METGKFSILNIEQWGHWLLEDMKKNEIFGISRRLFFKPSLTDPFRLKRFGLVLETPIGVAAGPHSQLTQNIIAAWLTGARYIELKTIQTLDELNVPKPCIDMEDEGYNCEWSQELKLQQSFDQYLNAWILLHILHHHFNPIPSTPPLTPPGFIFNLSIGYNMQGILADNVQWFLNKMENCQTEKEEKLERLRPLFPALDSIPIPSRISNNITLSTMHGCPPEEIETIARYLIEKRKYHTVVKLNPTLLGPATLRSILNQRLGFPTHVPDAAFDHDLKYDDAVHLIKSLQSCATQHGVDFGLKLTNTLESENNRPVFSPSEKMMYMSGRALHPLAITLAARLQQTFNGTLDISFSAGADAFNIHEIIAAGLKPVTVCSDILKPGGYSRLNQYLENLASEISHYQAKDIDDYIISRANHTGIDFKNCQKSSSHSLPAAALHNLLAYAEKVVDNPRYRKTSFPGTAIKTQRPLGLFDCIQAPCQTTCPAHQSVPAYMYYTARGDYLAALDVILKTNPFPTVTGMVCDHTCMTRCTRINYDNPLDIRAIKRFISENVTDMPPLLPGPPLGIRVGIIGAGPSGLSCAFFLALAGADVHIYETHDLPGGMITHAIPAFRLKEADLWNDIRRIEDLGVQFHYNYRADKSTFPTLKKNHDYLYIAIGAQHSSRLNIQGEENPRVIDAITFLAKVKLGETIPLGKRVAVIGGGNSAMDAARTAWRLLQEPGTNVTILYRRSRTEMPAGPEETQAAQAEGIEIMELTNPVKITPAGPTLKLTCWKMRLADKDLSGRPRPVKIENSDFDLYFDTIITAIGQQVNWEFLDEPLNPDRLTGKTSLKNTWVGGDALHGALDIISAIADGRRTANDILSSIGQSLEPSITDQPGALAERGLCLADYQEKAGRRVYGVHPGELPVNQRKNFSIVSTSLSPGQARQEASRCLLCSDVCNVCVTVCPNRANVSYPVSPVQYRLQRLVKRGETIRLEEDQVFRVSQPFQVLHIADLCNQCGNCRTFCPTAGSPFLDKPKIFLTQESFKNQTQGFFLDRKGNHPRVIRRQEGKNQTLSEGEDIYIYECVDENIHGCIDKTTDIFVEIDKNSFRVKQFTVKSPGFVELSLVSAAEMSIISAFAFRV